MRYCPQCLGIVGKTPWAIALLCYRDAVVAGRAYVPSDLATRVW